MKSWKWVGSKKVPVSGTIEEINPALADNPAVINDEPYGKGWVALIVATNLEPELAELMKGSDKEAIEAWFKIELEKTA